MSSTRKKVLRAAILAAIAIIPLAGCGGPKSGEVYAKEYQPAHSDFVMFMIPMSCGNNCTTSVPIMYWVEDDADWVLKIKDKKGDTNDIYVSEGAFSEYDEGDWYQSPDEAQTSDDVKKFKKKPR